MTTDTIQNSVELTAYQKLLDPRFFMKEVLGATPYDKQIEMMEAVRDNRRVSVVGCNGSGKDWTTARIVLWWMCTRYPAKAIVTGPTYRQVDEIVFNEIRNAYKNSRVPFKGRVFRTPRYQFDEQHFALGFSSDDEFNLQGFHSPNLLVVITEAHAVSRSDINSMRRLNPKCIIMTGNAFVSSGEFYDSHHSRRDIWKPISISAYDLPNIQQNKTVISGMMSMEDVEERRQEWGEDSALYKGSVLGEFVEDLDDTVINFNTVKIAAQRTAEPEGDVVLGCDIARFGKDKTVIFKRQGNHSEIVWQTQGRDLMTVAGWIGRYCSDNPVDTVVIDDTGLGGGVTDRLKETIPDKYIVPFKAGAAAFRKSEFGNQSTEAWFAMKDWLESGGSIPDEESLIGQLIGRRYEIRSDKSVILESKQKMANSPDEADALSMTFVDFAGEGVW